MAKLNLCHVSLFSNIVPLGETKVRNLLLRGEIRGQNDHYASHLLQNESKVSKRPVQGSPFLLVTGLPGFAVVHTNGWKRLHLSFGSWGVCEWQLQGSQ